MPCVKFEDSTGCRLRCALCKKDQDDIFHSRAAGCRAQCRICKQEWGKTPGCTRLPEGKYHNVIEKTDS